MIGERAMTREERNARRRELDKDPFHRKLTRRTAKAWRDKHRDEINARRRKKYAENPDRERARAKAWRDKHPESVKKAWRKWADKNVGYLRAKDRARAADPVDAERKREARRKRMEDPAVRARVREQKRMAYYRHKHDDKGTRWMVKFILEPRWVRLIAEPPERIDKYRRRCTVRTWSLFVKWARLRGLYFDPQKGES